MKKLILTAVATACCLTFVSAQAATQKRVSLLFVETAPTGTLTADTLTLNNVGAFTTYISDRPVRKFGYV
ncbi:hypothetical protein ABTM26_19475, partial [Acinetobacter baumannii]